MKKILIILSLALLCVSTEAQIIRANGNFTAPIPPEPPAEVYGIDEIWDGHTKMLYVWDTAVAVTSGHVTQWNDLSGNNYHLLPYAADGSDGTPDNQPAWHITDGVTLDGVDDALKALASGWTGFGTVYVLFRQVGWTDNDVMFGFAGTGSVRVAQDFTAEGGSPNLHLIHASGSSLAITGLPIGTWGVITLHVDAATSTASMKLNNGTSVTNLNSMAGFTSAGALLGAAHAAVPALQRWGNVAIKAIWYRDQIDAGTTETNCYNWISGL